jgi:hypothetical protein
MLPISPQALHLIESEAPDFRKAVLQAKKAMRGSRSPAGMQMRLERFHDDPFLLYACLWYALSKNVEVHFLTK